MATHLMIVLTNSVDGREEEFNDWYTNTHLRDIVTLDGFAAAQRFRLIPDDKSDGAPYRYLAIYELEGEDHEIAKNSLGAAAGTGMVVSSSLDSSTVAAWYFEAITDRLSEVDDGIGEL
jgi:hypothetical protein